MVTGVNPKAIGVMGAVKNQPKASGQLAKDKTFDQILQKEADQPTKEAKGTKPTQPVKTKGKTPTKQAKVDKESEVDEVNLTDVKKLEEDVITKVTEILGISEEQLTQMLEQLDMTVLDLLIPEKLNAFLVNFFGVDNTMELLALPDVSQIKALKTELTQMVEKHNIDPETLQKMIAFTEEKEQVPVNETSENQNNQQTPMEDQQVPEEEEVQDNTSKPQIEITDQRTESREDISTEVNPETAKVEQDFSQVLVDNQVVTKVEVVDQGGIREVVTVHVSTDDIMEQIVSSVKVNLSDDTNQMLIQLRPEHLGKLALSITSEQGVITANFMADNPAVKELIEANLAQLKVSLQEQGLNVDKLEVVVTDNQLMDDQRDNQQFGTNQDKNKRAARMMSVQSQGEEEELEEELIPNGDSVVDTLETSSIDYSV